jgi:hypothetical protein
MEAGQSGSECLNRRRKKSRRRKVRKGNKKTNQSISRFWASPVTREFPAIFIHVNT